MATRHWKTALGLIVVFLVVGVPWSVHHYRTSAGTLEPPLDPIARQRGERLVMILAGILPNADSDQFTLALAARVEDLASKCMTRRGRHYNPVDPRLIADTTTDTDFDSFTYAVKFGFGVTAFPVWPRILDPNVVAVQAMSSSLRTAYDSDLNSCENEAQQAANTEFGVAWANVEFDRVDTLVRHTSAYAMATKAWRDCAQQAGIQEVPSRTALIHSLNQQLQPILVRISQEAASQGDSSTKAVERLAESDTQYQRLKAVEIHDATATIQCSIALDSSYAAVFESQSAGSS